MLLLRHLERVGRRFPAPVVTLGNFDGVHRGHQEILRRVATRARELGGTAVALTFHPHPATVLAPDHVPPLLTDWRARVERIAAVGVETIIAQRFTRAFSEIGATDFVRRFLVDGLGARAVVVGHRVSFGHNREGGAETLRRLGAESGLAVEVIGPVEVDGVAVSSSAVRRAISNGELERARAYLGRPPSVCGRVVHGFHRGRQIGFPTVNLRVAGLMLPPEGVYAAWVRIGGATHPGVANLGYNPTFGDNERSLEAHLFDFDHDVYGQRAEISFVRRLRGEAKFASVQALVEQIARDAAAAREALATQ